MTMTTRSFAEELREQIIGRLGGVDIDIQEITKNNGNIRTGLVFKSEDPVAPVIYVDGFMSDYEDGKSVEEIAKEIMNVYVQSLLNKPTHSKVSDILDYSKSKDTLRVCAINSRKNEELISTCPHKIIGDVALIVKVVVDATVDNLATVTVSNQILDEFGVSEEELFEDAWESMGKNTTMKFMDMVDTLAELVPEELRFMMEDNRGEMYVLRSADKVFGAAFGFNPDNLSEICGKLDTDKVYILPSSIHEVIIVPGNKVPDESNLSSIVAGVNESSVDATDVLSDKAYVFDMETKEIKMV